MEECWKLAVEKMRQTLKAANFQNHAARLHGFGIIIPEEFAGCEIPAPLAEILSHFPPPSLSFAEFHSAIEETFTVRNTTLWSPLVSTGAQEKESAHAKKGRTGFTFRKKLLLTELEWDVMLV